MNWLWGLLAQSAPDYIVLGNPSAPPPPPPPSYQLMRYESACRSHIIRIAYRHRSRSSPVRVIERFEIDGRPVPGAVATLQLRAAGRPIERISIRNCGMDPRNPVIVGDVEHSEGSSYRERLRPDLAFELKREGKAWKFAIVR
jgi:hypothetical protein